MYTNIAIAGDAHRWTLADTDAAALRDAVGTGGHPLAVPVVAPVAGRLLIAPHTVAAVAVLPVPPGGDWMPSYVHVPSAALYLPSAAAGTPADTAFALAAGADLTALEEQVLGALHGRHRIEIPLAGAPGNVLILDGAMLSLVVLIPA